MGLFVRTIGMARAQLKIALANLTSAWDHGRTVVYQPSWLDSTTSGAFV
jgi:hypothetical protein